MLGKFNLESRNIFGMETTKDERPVAKRLRNRNIFEDEEEFGAVVENFFMAEAKRQRRTGNLIWEHP